MQSNYVMVIGSLNCDLIFLQNRMPMRGETFLANGLQIASGGKGANQAAQLAKLGQTTFMVGNVGRDSLGDFLCRELSRFGVDVSHVTRCGTATGTAAVNSMPDGIYYATVAPGANSDFTVEQLDDMKSMIQNAAAIVLQLEIPIPVVEHAVELASDAGVYIVLNAAPASDISDACLKKVDCLIVNELEAAYYIGQTIDTPQKVETFFAKLLEKVKSSLIITLGDRGSVLCTREGVYHFAITEPVEVMDTTGSGDSYVGAFVYMKVRGVSDVEACEFASLVSQYTVSRVGGQASMPYYEEVAEKWEKRHSRGADKPSEVYTAHV